MVVPQKKKSKYFSNVNVFVAALIANLTATAATCVMSWSSPALPMITQPGSKILVTKEEGALLSSIAALGAFFGPFASGQLADKYGRKRTLLGGMVVMVATWAVFYVCDVLAILIGTRFLAGICAGCVYGTLPMYISEISPMNLRGSLASFLQFFDCIGYLVMNVGGSYVSYENLALLSASVPILCFALFFWIPESPYFLQTCGKDVDASRALQFFRDNADISELKVEMDDMMSSARDVREKRESIWSLFRTRANLKRVYYAAALVFFQQTSGINVITFYSKTVFIETGSKVSPDASSIILHLVMTAASLVTVTASRIYKLRSMLLFSSVGITISMGFLGGFFFLKEVYPEVVHSLDWVPLASLAFYMAAFTLGWGPLIWCITSVIFPAQLKARACGMCASFMWLMTFVLTSTFQSIDPSVGFTLFALATFVSAFFVQYHLPETNGKTFQEIQAMIDGDQLLPCVEKRDHCTPL